MDSQTAQLEAHAEHLLPLSLTPHALHAHHAHAKPLGTPLATLAGNPTALITPSIKSVCGFSPTDGNPVHIAQLLSDATAILICFRQTTTTDWTAIRRELTTAKELGVRVLLVTGSISSDEMASALYGAGDLCVLHGVKEHAGRSVAFKASDVLACALTIQHGRRIRNGLILVKDGALIARSFGPNSDSDHNWGPIKLALSKGSE